MNFQDLGAHFHTLSKENLLASISQTNCVGNLLVTSRETSKVLNFLTPFGVLKETGGFDRSVLIDQISLKDEFLNTIQAYTSLTVIVSNENTGTKQLKKFWSWIDHQKLSNINIIVQNLNASFYYQILRNMLNYSEDILEKCSKFDPKASTIRLSAKCRLFSWKIYPFLIHDNIFSINMEDGGLSAYLENPLKIISSLNDLFMDILSETMARKDIIKIKNIFAKGDHSSLLIKTLVEESIPEFLSTKLTINEQEFYSKKQSGNTDLIVLERNLDYFPLVLSHTNYMGLLDDLFGTDDELNNILSTKDKLDDELFHNLKHLNFASIGVKLNKLAKYIQLEFEQNGKANDLAEIKQLVKNLGNLSSKQDMIRKHTHLSETMLQLIKCNKDGTQKFNAHELWYELQNEVFDLDYKQQVKKVHSMMEQSSPFEIVMSLVVLTSLINDGWRQHDMDVILISIQLNFGLKGALTLRKLLNYKIIKVHTKGTDFFGAFTFGKTEIETTTASTLATTSGNNPVTADAISYEDSSIVGISSGQDVYKSTYTLISKFWNLHPLEEEDTDSSAVETVFDYKQPSFTLPSATVPLITRIVELLYFREFLKYKPVNNVLKRPNWHNLNIDTMFKGQTIDKNVCDMLENRKGAMKGTEQHYVILVILGGITRSEISAFQNLQGKLDRKILVVTTGLVSNKKFWQVIE